MTICQFFLQGRCRFGENCRNEHSYNEGGNIRNTTSSQQLSNFIKQSIGEIILAEQGGQWPLSCFAPFKEGANIPGWKDISPEEVRWKMYEARANGTLNQCINEVKQWYKEAEKRRNDLKQPTMEVINAIVNLIKDKKDPSNLSNPFASSTKSSSTDFKFNTSSSNVFGIGSQSAGNQGNVFGSPPAGVSQGSIFGGSPQLSANQGNIFGGGGGSSASCSNQNIFGGSNSSNNFNQNVFSNAQTSSQGIFSTPAVGNTNVFSSASNVNQNIFSNAQTPLQGNSPNSSVNAFSSAVSAPIFSNQSTSGSVFGSQSGFFQNVDNKNQTQNQPNVFGNSQSGENVFKNTSSFGSQSSGDVFGSQSQQTAMDLSVYSKPEDLNEEELKSFAAATFTFGKIPLKPPPQSYCK